MKQVSEQNCLDAALHASYFAMVYVFKLGKQILYLKELILKIHNQIV